MNIFRKTCCRIRAYFAIRAFKSDCDGWIRKISRMPKQEGLCEIARVRRSLTSSIKPLPEGISLSFAKMLDELEKVIEEKRQ